MNNLVTATFVELMKLRRSSIVLITIALFVFIPSMMALLMYISQNPDISEKLGLMGAKAQFFAGNTWEAYFNIINQVIAVLGIIGFGFVTSWIFGREYIDHTLTDILSLPVSRNYIVSAKFIVMILWCTILSATMYTSTLVFGQLLFSQIWIQQELLNFTLMFFTTVLLTILPGTIIGFVVCYSRGIVAPIGFVLLMIIMAQFAAMAGLGAYFPWSIAGIYSISNTNNEMQLVPISYIIIFLTALAGLAATYLYWNKADH